MTTTTVAEPTVCWQVTCSAESTHIITTRSGNELWVCTKHFHKFEGFCRFWAAYPELEDEDSPTKCVWRLVYP